MAGTELVSFLFVNDEDIKILQEKVEQIRHRYPDAHITMNYELTKSYYEGRERAWKERVKCSAGTEGMVIAPDGKVVLCEQLPTIGDIDVEICF